MAHSLTRVFSDKRACALAIACGGLLALTTAALFFCIGFRELPWLAQAGFLQYALSWAAVLAVFVIGVIAAYMVETRTQQLVDSVSRKNPWPWMTLDFNRISIVKAAIFIFVFWLPFAILQYPCAMNGDTYNQLYQFQTSYPTLYTTMGITVDASFVDHHPVFDTLLYGSFLALGDILGSQNVGLFLFTLTQNILGAFGLGAACCYLVRLGVPKVFRLVSLFFCAWFFLMPLWASIMVKDSTHAIFLVPFFLCYIEVFRTRGKAMENMGFVFLFIVLALGAALTKKPGFYMVSASLLVLTLYCLRGWHFKRLVAVFLVVPVVQLAFLPLVLYPAIGGVEPGGKQESFGFAMQQVITVMLYEDDLTQDERDAVTNLINVDRAMEKYSPGIVDPVKNSARSDATSQDYLRFVGAYFSIGLRHIPLYAYSIGATTSALYCPGVELTYNSTPDQEDSWKKRFADADTKHELSLTFYKPQAIERISKAFLAWYEAFVQIPGVSFIVSKGLFGGWIPLICIVLSLYGGRRYLVAYMPVIISLAFVVIGPAVSTRYMVPLLFITVLSMGLLCNALTEGRQQLE